MVACRLFHEGTRALEESLAWSCLSGTIAPARLYHSNPPRRSLQSCQSSGWKRFRFRPCLSLTEACGESLDSFLVPVLS